jgi:hypothetical protein
VVFLHTCVHCYVTFILYYFVFIGHCYIYIYWIKVLMYRDIYLSCLLIVYIGWMWLIVMCVWLDNSNVCIVG